MFISEIIITQTQATWFVFDIFIQSTLMCNRKLILHVGSFDPIKALNFPLSCFASFIKSARLQMQRNTFGKLQTLLTRSLHCVFVKLDTS